MVECFRFRREHTPLLDGVSHVLQMVAPPPLPVPLQDITTLSRCLPEDVLSSTTFFVLIFMGYTSAHIAIFGSKVGLPAIDIYYFLYIEDRDLLVFLLIC